MGKHDVTGMVVVVRMQQPPEWLAVDFVTHNYLRVFGTEPLCGYRSIIGAEQRLIIELGCSTRARLELLELGYNQFSTGARLLKAAKWWP